MLAVEVRIARREEMSESRTRRGLRRGTGSVGIEGRRQRPKSAGPRKPKPSRLAAGGSRSRRAGQPCGQAPLGQPGITPLGDIRPLSNSGSRIGALALLRLAVRAGGAGLFPVAAMADAVGDQQVTRGLVVAVLGVALALAALRGRLEAEAVRRRGGRARLELGGRGHADGGGQREQRKDRGAGNLGAKGHVILLGFWLGAVIAATSLCVATPGMGSRGVDDFRRGCGLTQRHGRCERGGQGRKAGGAPLCLWPPAC